MIRKVLVVLVLAVGGAAAYAGAPLVTAWQIREAVRTANTETLAAKVDWASVRQSLKQSTSEARLLLGEMSESAGVGKPGLWQRLKAAAAPYLADPLIDRYVTAEGAPQIWAWRQTWREKVRPRIGLSEPPTVLAGTWAAGTNVDRGLSFARRVERVAFTSPTRVEIEVRDRHVEHRRLRAVMELRSATWTLTDVQLVRIAPGGDRISSR